MEFSNQNFVIIFIEDQVTTSVLKSNRLLENILAGVISIVEAMVMIIHRNSEPSTF